ncbi:MAG: transposase [Candidatus Marinimicrobia bacterium]|nr:transposase [Candidatus Neomarinimicrobiota bacterium]MDD5582060.1 transposase [Candidatus Neomarinimicrobiota bacterium]
MKRNTEMFESVIKNHLETHGHQHIYTAVQQDHVHVLFFMNPDISLSLYLKVFLRDTANIINKHLHVEHLIWNPEYYAVSCPLNNLERQINDLSHQPQYHETQSYYDELKHYLELMLETSCVAENLPQK